MEQRLTPNAFYGSAIAALAGLMLGLAFHGAWEKHPGGPQILFSAAQAAVTHPDPADSVEAIATTDQTEVADLDTGYVKPDPLPVVRLHPEMFDVQPAATDGAERTDADDLVKDNSEPTAAEGRDEG